jgi:hypothetical protein
MLRHMTRTRVKQILSPCDRLLLGNLEMLVMRILIYRRLCE